MKRMSFDINTRPIINSLSKHRHTAFGSYFVVAGKDLEPVRVGAKVIAFRGGRLAEEFANKFRASRVDVLDKMEGPGGL